MPVRPAGPGRLVVTGEDGTVIFDGEGEVVLMGEISREDPMGGTAVLRLREGDYRAEMDLTGLLRTHEHAWAVEYDIPPVSLTPDPDPLRIESPRVACTRLSIDIPSSFALSLRHELYAGHPDYRRQAELHSGDVTRVMRQLREDHMSPRQAALRLFSRSEMTDAEVLRLYEQAIQPEAAVREDAGMSRIQDPEGAWAASMARQRALYEAREQLMASTRQEFPPDPYEYGRRHPDGPHRWTPPEDPDEVIPSCPA